ncbi:MAG: radical SAM protein [Candidatus Omnitrophica bacterium]|nr:radical SAM protein [Candidatus Omnitrophota bacterium]
MRIRNLFNMGASSLEYKLFNSKIPLNVMLALTDRCTSKCIYCSIPERNSTELKTSDIFRIMDDLKLLGCQRLAFWGGEPLIRDDIAEIVRYSAGKGFYTTMDTNGHLIPDKIKQIEHINHIIVGLDGPDEVHDTTRGKGSFKKVIRALELLKDKLPVWTITVLNKYNIDRIEDLIQLAKKYNFKTTFQILHHNEFLAPGYKYIMPKDDEIRDAIMKIIGFKKKGYPVASSFSYLYYLLRWPAYDSPVSQYKIGGMSCLAGKLFCNIDVNGDLYPCSLLINKIEGINVLGNGFKKAFDSLQSPDCKSCAASCYVEYNNIFSLKIGTIFDWFSAMRR